MQNAAKVRDKILEQTGRLRENPEMHPPDKYKSGNDGSYRAFETYRFRISYRVLEDKIKILRLRHTSQNPQEY
ncbi:type II toxin-antitoxin system RelE/ParE family toxin [Paracnuella aquatica]|uniref:type II toxin-antitoxin system RelE/ParE family toxin n=1 Tax=Paracnuella aquatica TaxID=2268757 RepID=UPI00240DEB5C|nr:type II toxin-antitoxin system RelE/ParE family toxin [Paracnuella aquatica]